EQLRLKLIALLLRAAHAHELRGHPFRPSLLAQGEVLFEKKPWGQVMGVRTELRIDGCHLVSREDSGKDSRWAGLARVLAHPDQLLAGEEVVEHRFVGDNLLELPIRPDLPRDIAGRPQSGHPIGESGVVRLLEEADHLLGAEAPAIEILLLAAQD